MRVSQLARRPAFLALVATASILATGMSAGVAILNIDADRAPGKVDERIYGQFLEHINHSVVDGLYAEQVRGQGFEGKDFADYWKTFGKDGSATLVEERFKNGERSVRVEAKNGAAGIRQGRFNVHARQIYDGYVWLKSVDGSLAVSVRLTGSSGKELATAELNSAGTDWHEAPFRIECPDDDEQATLEISGAGTGAILVDFVSFMNANARSNGKLRPDLLASLQGLKPPFIRWPGGSYASVYKWKDGIGPAVSRRYNPNPIWGDYSDYYGFGTDEFMELCRQLGSQPLVVLAATAIDPAQRAYAMDWVHYMLDPSTTEWGARRAANGHPEPYDVPYIQIDNEPMNHELSPDDYAAIVNYFGSELRKIAPKVKIVASGQKRSNDMEWSQKLIDIAGDNFDILGCHNYEYEPKNFATGVRRIEDYLEKLSDYIRISAHPDIRIAVLEWGLCRSYDWRAGLHAAGSLMSYEKLSPTLAMSCPALLMRNTTDDPDWRAWIYHDHVSWFAGGGYIAEKLFRDHFAPESYAFASGTFKDLKDRASFFDGISQMKPEEWMPGTVDAIATGEGGGRRVVIKAVNYDGQPHTLLTRLKGARIPASATVTLTTIAAPLDAANTLDEPERIHPSNSTIPFARDMAFSLPPYSIAVVEIRGSE